MTESTYCDKCKPDTMGVALMLMVEGIVCFAMGIVSSLIFFSG